MAEDPKQASHEPGIRAAIAVLHALGCDPGVCRDVLGVHVGKRWGAEEADQERALWHKPACLFGAVFVGRGRGYKGCVLWMACPTGALLLPCMCSALLAFHAPPFTEKRAEQGGARVWRMLMCFAVERE
eukprot:scaffold105824_cov19-Tisochrysis_lutea.AAC.1